MKRKRHSAGFKFKVALAALKGDRTIADICQTYEIAASQVHQWKKNLLEHGVDIFDKDKPKKAQQSQANQTAKLYEKIGELTVDRDFLKKSWEVYNDRND